MQSSWETLRDNPLNGGLFGNPIYPDILETEMGKSIPRAFHQLFQNQIIGASPGIELHINDSDTITEYLTINGLETIA